MRRRRFEGEEEGRRERGRETDAPTKADAPCAHTPPALPQNKQVFYHLGELDSALTYALGAGDLFDVDDQSEYTRTLVGERRAAERERERATGGGNGGALFQTTPPSVSP